MRLDQSHAAGEPAPAGGPGDWQALQRAAAALRQRGIEAIVVGDRASARAESLGRIPAGAEVLTAASETVDELGLLADLEHGPYRSLRARLAQLPAEARRERARLRATPEWVVGSVQALTEDGRAVVVSESGSQLAAYAHGAAHVIWIIGAQKVVPDLDAALARVAERVQPGAAARLGRVAPANKILIVDGETERGRITAILVAAQLGV